MPLKKPKRTNTLTAAALGGRRGIDPFLQLYAPARLRREQDAFGQRTAQALFSRRTARSSFCRAGVTSVLRSSAARRAGYSLAGSWPAIMDAR